MSVNINYNWKIDTIQYKPLLEGFTDYVVFVKATYVATTEGAVAYQYAANEYYPKEGDTIIPLEDILADKSIVVGWIEAGLDIPALQEVMRQEIEEYLNPPVVKIGNPYND